MPDWALLRNTAVYAQYGERLTDTTFLEPYNMQLWEDLLQINGINLRLIHYKKDIRTNYDVCICLQQVTAVSVAVILFFTVFLV